MNHVWRKEKLFSKVSYLASLLSGSGMGWHTLHPSLCGRRTRTAPPLAAHGETAGRANATAGSRWRGAGLSCGTPADGHPKTCREYRWKKENSVNYLQPFFLHPHHMMFLSFKPNQIHFFFPSVIWSFLGLIFVVPLDHLPKSVSSLKRYLGFLLVVGSSYEWV